MKKFLAIASVLFLTACSSGGSEFQTNEQSFISGNGIVTTIEKDARKTAPLITGPMLGGGEFVGSEGKVRVMNVWASWCSPCRAEAPALQDLAEAHPEVEFVGVLTRDNLVSAKAFIDRFGITYPTITDDAILAKFTGQLSVNAIPTTLLIDKSGRVAARISGEITYSKMDELLIGLRNE
jgi:thiol-disulfide isomerase/thioredoxin